ncbi:nuclear transport factor 2 family protein [Streptomyces sp. E5N91]|uniref:nuclear transport factor 2 family protein n=1 Tax=Streptomyces sp. E5N91 TaxID=1851996 RepID=UPI000EF60DFB|nr:nuclear transport factor 2 family protein [Streptomyces sp. E5N91]
MEDLVFHDRTLHPEAPFDSMHGFGHYHDDYRRTEGGWLIASSELTRLRLDIVR